MTDPIRHELISFKTKNEAETFKLVLEHTFGEYAFTDVEIERCTGKGINPEGDFKMLRYEVIAYNRRMNVPKRVRAFVIGWASATTHHLQSDEAQVLLKRDTEYDLYLYR